MTIKCVRANNLSREESGTRLRYAHWQLRKCLCEQLVLEMSMLKLARNTCRKRRRIQWHFITGIFILFSFGLVYRRLTNTPSFTNGLSNPTQTLKDNETEKTEIRFTKEIEEDRSIIACKVPNVDPFHPSVVKFMRDVGKLNCQGPRFSSYDNNVLRIEGQGLVSAQYRKILRAPGNDFSVVLSDPVNIQNETSDQKGKLQMSDLSSLASILLFSRYASVSLDIESIQKSCK